MIYTIVRNGFRALRRDRGALILSFVLPVAFFSIFAVVFANMGASATARVSVLVVDEDHSAVSERLVRALEREPSLAVSTRPESKPGIGAPVTADYTAASAEAAVKQGSFPAALIIPSGFGAEPIAFGPAANREAFTILDDPADPVASQVLAGMLQKVVMTSSPDLMATAGVKYLDQASGGLSPAQREHIQSDLDRLRDLQASDTEASSNNGAGGMVTITKRDVVGEKKHSPMISFYAAGIGVMFLLFTASAAGGSLLDEADTGALDRILSAQVSMTTLLAGKLVYCTLLASSQLVLMFLWGAAVFHLDLFTHIPGFLVMTLVTSFAVACFGMLLASLSRTRAQQSAVSTLIILSMSAMGGSMFPRFLMPELMKKIGLFTINAWAIDGFTKVFWRDEPITHLAPQVAALAAYGIILFAVARRFARRWEYT